MSDSRLHFELNVSLPYDSRFTETVRRLVVHAAQQAGSDAPDAEAFGRTVDEALQDVMRTCPEARRPGADLNLVIRKSGGPVEVVIGPRTFTLEP